MIALADTCERCGRAYQPTADAVEWVALREQTSGAPTYCGGCRRFVCEACFDPVLEQCLDCVGLPASGAALLPPEAAAAEEAAVASPQRSWLRRHPHVVGALAGFAVLAGVLLLDLFGGTGGEVAREPPPLGDAGPGLSPAVGEETGQPAPTLRPRPAPSSSSASTTSR